MAHGDDLPVLREGVWLYDGSVPVRVALQQSDAYIGTGDYEDEPEIADGRPEPCVFIAYEAAGSPGRYRGGVHNLPSLEAALARAEKMFPGIVWDPVP